MTAKVKRSLFQSYMDTTPLTTPTYSRMGDGIVTAKVSMNAKTTEETYINEDTASISVDSYAPNLPIEHTAKVGDPVFEFVFNMYQTRAVGSDAETYLLHVYTFQTSYSGWYAAERQLVAIAVDDFGETGGKPNKLNYTCHYNGDAEIGWYNATSGVFIAAADIVLTLATLAFTTPALTLTPAFSGAVLTYTASTTSATGIITATATDPDATVAILAGATPVVSGASAAFAMGANVVTVTVTVGDQSRVYTITVTRS